MAESSSEAEPPPNRFNNLPFKLKVLIIEATLPQQRIFHVSRGWMEEYQPKKTDTHKDGGGMNECEPKETGPDRYGFTFYNRHPPPVLLSVCSAWRAAVLECGVFLDARGDNRGAFFMRTIDMLYLDAKNTQHYIKRWYGPSTDADAARWADIRHLGFRWHQFEWAAAGELFDETVPFIKPSVTWGPMLEIMRMRIPMLQRVTVIVPIGVCWDFRKWPRLDGVTGVLAEKLRRDTWELGMTPAQRTAEPAKRATCGPRRNWCRCRRRWRCPVTFFKTFEEATETDDEATGTADAATGTDDIAVKTDDEATETDNKLLKQTMKLRKQMMSIW